MRRYDPRDGGGAEYACEVASLSTNPIGFTTVFSVEGEKSAVKTRFRGARGSNDAEDQ